MNFKEHCQLRGIEIHRDDLKFIKTSLAKLPYPRKREAVKGYLDEWLTGMEKTEKSFQKQNFGRFSANTYLRRLVD
jgi:hypothetical protein